MIGRRERVARLLRPRSIAFVGGGWVRTAIRNALDLGFDGDVWAVNPKHDHLAGVRCYPTLSHLPGVPDAVFVGVRNEATVEVVAELAELGAGGAVCLAAGFAELGTESGRELQRRLVAAAGEMPVVGPNCYGVLNYVDGVALWPDLHGGGRVPAGIALIAQSGNVSLNVTMADRSVRLTHVISSGNQAVVGAADLIEVLAADDRVRAIGVYLEGIGDPDAFVDAVGRARDRHVPVVVLRTGRTTTSADIVRHHTASEPPQGGADGAVLGAAGAVEVRSLTSLLESLKLFDAWGPHAARRLLVLSASGGDIAMFADLAAGLEFPALSSGTTERLREQLGHFVTIANPLDYNNLIWGDRDELERCFLTAMADGGAEAAVLILDLPREGSGDPSAWNAAIDALIAAQARTGLRTAVVSTFPEGLPGPARQRVLEAGIAPLQGLSEAVEALGAASRWPDQPGADPVASSDAEPVASRGEG
jgi:acetate---CoA ligase (ADP-forming)